jgi:hypothetical protein
VVDLRAPAQRLPEGRRTDRGDHELLNIDASVGMCAAIEDVEHRDRQHVRVHTTDIAEQLQAAGLRSGLGDR